MTRNTRPGYNPVLTRTGALILETLIKREGINGAQLIEMLYSDKPDGGPLNAGKCLSVQIHRVRWALRPLGIEIRSYDYPGCHGGYCSYMMPTAHKELAKQFLINRVPTAARLFRSPQLELFAHA